MTACFYKYHCLPVLFLLLAAVGPVQAQDTPVAVSEEQAAKAKTEEVEASSNLRESIHENLETIQEDTKAAEELKKAETEKPPAELQQQVDSVEESDSAAPAPGKMKSILAYIKLLPGYLQSVPERVPFIRDRGLIFFGRSELDYAHYSSGITKSDSGFRVRSLRAGLAKAFKHNLSMKAEVDLTDGDSNFADLFVRYRHKRFGLFTAGNQRVAQTLVNQTSRISRTFMEEPLPAEAFGLGRRLALGWDFHKPKGGVHVTLFGPDLNGSIGDSGLASRVYFNPTRSRFSLFHVGASIVSENMSRKTRFFSHPESRVTDAKGWLTQGIYRRYQSTATYCGSLKLAGAKDSLMFSQ